MDTTRFRPSGFFAFRTPLLPFDELLAWGEGLEAPSRADQDPIGLEQAVAADRVRLHERLRASVTTPEFREALFIASPGLDERVEVWLREPDTEAGQKIERALVRYFQRMTSRATPFGLFAGCSVGTIGSRTELQIRSRACYRRQARHLSKFVPAPWRSITTTRSWTGSMKTVDLKYPACPKESGLKSSVFHGCVPIPQGRSLVYGPSVFVRRPGSISATTDSARKRFAPYAPRLSSIWQTRAISNEVLWVAPPVLRTSVLGQSSGRTLQSTPESGERAGFDGAKKKKGSKVHVAVDTMGNLLALKVTAANEQEREQVAELAAKVQEVTGGTVEIGFVDQGYTGENAAQQASEHGIKLEVVKHTEAKKGFVLLPRRWVVERTFGWLGRFRRLTRDYERLAQTLAGWHWLAFVILIVKQVGLQSQ